MWTECTPHSQMRKIGKAKGGKAAMESQDLDIQRIVLFCLSLHFLHQSAISTRDVHVLYTEAPDHVVC